MALLFVGGLMNLAWVGAITDGRGNVKTITIVGIDEADLSRGQVSWVSPVARALMRAHDGDIVEVRAPSGVEQIEVLEIRAGGVRGETE